MNKILGYRVDCSLEPKLCRKAFSVWACISVWLNRLEVPNAALSKAQALIQSGDEQYGVFLHLH